MHKMTFVLDEDKINSEGKYKPESIYKAVEEVANNAGASKISDTEYAGTFENIGIIMINLEKYTWFMDYVKEWYWLNNEYSDVYDKDDILEELEKHRQMEERIRKEDEMKAKRGRKMKRRQSEEDS